MATEKILSRDLYRKVKSMNKDEMENFLQTVYKMGEDNVEGKTLDLDVLKTELMNIPGIGLKRLEQIMTVIKNNIQ